MKLLYLNFFVTQYAVGPESGHHFLPGRTLPPGPPSKTCCCVSGETKSIQQWRLPMPAKELKFGHDARQRMAIGASLLARAVKATLGPRGRNVVIRKPFGAPAVTKDGVSVAREIELEDQFEDMGGTDGQGGGRENVRDCGRRHHNRYRAGAIGFRRRAEVGDCRDEPDGYQARHR